MSGFQLCNGTKLFCLGSIDVSHQSGDNPIPETRDRNDRKSRTARRYDETATRDVGS